MKREILTREKGTPLRKNGLNELEILINPERYKEIFLINGTSFLTDRISKSDLIIKPHDYYMVINKSKKDLEIKYNEDISNFDILYDPYKFENVNKVNYKQEDFLKNYKIPEGYIDTLPKWYSFKFTYSDYNLIFIRPELGISVQIHDHRNEIWEILEGRPIIINGNEVHYFVESGKIIKIPKNTYHTIINPNLEKFVMIKEDWNGKFDEEDVIRVFNPNHYC